MPARCRSGCRPTRSRSRRSRDHSEYAVKVLDALEAEGVRGVLFASADTLSRRIVAAHEASIPVVAVVGQREAQQGTVSLRERPGAVSVLPLADAVEALRARARPGKDAE
ncbi:His/Gly/Thr/Pro-type tRNA ligase C-terminal domain-containing protein [Bradyrhizobium sp. B124]|uniref:His/Gly/Thr/Pro-type tRNA ligase C-terminal domain-containing protein n=1 Tax=Bradyrhizobium sp. B124 TaxID=3140245 RepID=UPI003183DA0F